MPSLRHLARRGRAILRNHRARWVTKRALRAVAAFPTVAEQTAHGLPYPLMVSLTSYPPRFPTLALTLRSLLDQRTRADRTVLWVTPEEEAGLPADVLALRDHGLEVAHAPELRSYKKLVPTLEAHPGWAIATADDDLYYPPDWLSRLVAAARAQPGAIVGLRCHMARTNAGGRLLPYNEWEYETAATEARQVGERLFPTGGAGVLYPPGTLSPRTLDRDTFMRLCPSADDVWFFWMARLAGTEHRRASGTLPLVTWPDSQEVALFRRNVTEDSGNDQAIRALEAELGPVP